MEHSDKQLDEAIAKVQAKVLRPKCVGCGNDIDPLVCWCGDGIDEKESYHDNHHPIPMGCDCYRSKD